MMLPWSDIDCVLLDMDGTLLDKRFDDDFWEEHVPEEVARRSGVPLHEVKQRLYAEYRAAEGTLNWTDVDFWSKRFDLDILSLKRDRIDRIGVHLDAIPFLEYLKRLKKRIILATNAHPKVTEIKMSSTPLSAYFETMICSADMGAPKEQDLFWRNAQERLGFDKQKTLFIDDTEAVLYAAEQFGIRFLLQKTVTNAHRQIATGRFTSLCCFSEIIDGDRPNPS